MFYLASLFYHQGKQPPAWMVPQIRQRQASFQHRIQQPQRLLFLRPVLPLFLQVVQARLVRLHRPPPLKLNRLVT